MTSAARAAQRAPSGRSWRRSLGALILIAGLAGCATTRAPASSQEVADPIVWVSGYSNDVMTYIPSLRIWKEGGYEGGDAMKWGTHPTRWSARTKEHIITTVHELRRSLNP